MQLIKLTAENLADEHICCAISNNTDIQVASKKAWLAERLAEGLVFLKADLRGKCFVEYIPAEYAWAPVDAPGYMYINCLWVSGKYKGHGYSNLLLEECIRDSQQKGKAGLVILSSAKKQGFLSDPKYMRYKGFALADTAAPYFQLLYLPFAAGAEKPRFKPRLQAERTHGMGSGFTLYYTCQCPFTAKYVPLLAEQAQKRGVPFEAVQLTNRQQAQSAPSPFTTFALFYEGALVTHEILSEKKFDALLTARGF